MQVPRLLEAVWKFLEKYFTYGEKYYTRRIAFTQGDNMQVRSHYGQRDVFGSEETSTERNNILQKAIRLYINKDKSLLRIKDRRVVGDGAFSGLRYGRRN